MDLYNLVVSAKLTKGGGGDEPVLIDKAINENGVYNASADEADGYKKVTVSVPSSGITPSGTSNITANGIYDVTNFASASVNVPASGITPTGTSTITANGMYDVTNFASASVSVPVGVFPTGTSSITSNGIYDITNFASVDVNVSGGGGGDITADQVAMRTISGAISGSASFIASAAFANCSSLTTASFLNVTSIGASAFSNCFELTTVSFPKVTSIAASPFRNCSKLMSAYFLASSVATLGTNGFTNTPMSSSSYTGSFGSIYVPASLVDSYKTATNWSLYADRITSYVE